MAGNFWQSSHFQQWLLDRQDLARERQADLAILTEEEYSKIMIFFSHFIQAIGEQLKVKQQVISTAIVYFRRFYVRNSLKCIDPLLLAPTCLFLASKVEEFGVISNTRLISTCQAVVKNKFAYAYPQEWPYRINHVLEVEFYLLELMDCCLILYHPYRPLTLYIQDVKDMKDTKEQTAKDKDEMLNTAWNILNDSYRTDIPLLYPPHLIAISAMHMACVSSGKDFKQWFAELNIDLDKVLEISQHMFQLYELWKNFDERKEIPPLLAKMPKPKSQPSR
jgi:cyclin C